MSQPEEPLFPPLPPEEQVPPASRQGALLPILLSWSVIVALITVFLLLQHQAEQRRIEGKEDRLGLLLFTVQGRMLVGVQQVLGVPTVFEQAQPLNTGPILQRLRFVVLAGELQGPDEALRRLKALDDLLAANNKIYSPEEARWRSILERLYTEYVHLRFDAPAVGANERAELRQGLGWFGDLALHPRHQALPRHVLPAAGGAAEVGLHLAVREPDSDARKEVLAPAARAFLLNFGALGIGCIVGLLGLVGLIVFLILAAKGKIVSGLGESHGPGSVYAETFAVWLGLFTLLSAGTALLPPEAPRLLLSGGVALLSLAALAWPVLRGVPWRQVREDIGLTLGKRPLVEPWCGAAGYAMTLPLLALGLLLTTLLLSRQRGPGGEVNFGPSGTPAHPVALDVAFGDTGVRLLVFALACFGAPLVEEIMFRGVLYRHLRESTRAWGTTLSFLFGAAVNCVVFAIIHPQGLVAIPILAALAVGFTLTREWRGTLVPAMVAHGLSNTVTLLGQLLLFSG